MPNGIHPDASGLISCFDVFKLIINWVFGWVKGDTNGFQPLVWLPLHTNLGVVFVFYTLKMNVMQHVKVKLTLKLNLNFVFFRKTPDNLTFIE